MKLAFQSLLQIVEIVTLNAGTRKFSELVRKRLHKKNGERPEQLLGESSKKEFSVIYHKIHRKNLKNWSISSSCFHLHSFHP